VLRGLVGKALAKICPVCQSDTPETMKLTLISITKDDPEGIRRTLDSTEPLRVLPGVEQIIVDSTPDPVAQKNLETEVKGRSQCRLFWMKPSGISAAFNKGVELAQGEWVWFINGGDEFNTACSPQLVLDYLDEARCDLIVGEMVDVDAKSGVVLKTSARPAFHLLWPPLINWIPHPSTLIKKEWLLGMGGFRDKYRVSMDLDLWMRAIASRARFDLVSLPLSRFFSGAGVSSHKKSESRELVRLCMEQSPVWFGFWLRVGAGLAWNFLRLVKRSVF